MKTTSKILAAVLALAMVLALAACGNKTDPAGTTASTEPSTTAKPSTTTSTTASASTSAPARLTAEDARAIYAAFLENHEELADYTLGEGDETCEWQDGQYYLFHAENPTYYWYNILVDMETGELLFMMMSDGEFPETIVQPLDSWYAETYE